MHRVYCVRFPREQSWVKSSVNITNISGEIKNVHNHILVFLYFHVVKLNIGHSHDRRLSLYVLLTVLTKWLKMISNKSQFNSVETWNWTYIALREEKNRKHEHIKNSFTVFIGNWPRLCLTYMPCIVEFSLDDYAGCPRLANKRSSR